jgi:hypothetical protein
MIDQIFIMYLCMSIWISPDGGKRASQKSWSSLARNMPFHVTGYLVTSRACHPNIPDRPKITELHANISGGSTAADRMGGEARPLGIFHG